MSQSALSNSVALGIAAKAALDAPFRLLPPDTFHTQHEGATRRDRIWELSSNLHCSIIGTCLSTGDLRSLLNKVGHGDARTASDHALHGRGVMLAGRRDGGGKLLQKLLDRRHEREIDRFAKAKTTEEVRLLWREYLDRGDIPGAYWAVLTHPATNSSLVQEVFGDVHMLSHLVGRSSRADVKRLAEVETELVARDETIAAQNARIHGLTNDRTALAAKVDDLERLLATRSTSRTDEDLLSDLARRDMALSALQQKLDREGSHRVTIEERGAKLASCLATLREELRHALAEIDEIKRERDKLEAILSVSLEDCDTDLSRFDGLRGKTILYVGGRPQTVSRLAALVSQTGGLLLDHDGGVEDSPALLAGLISRADLVLFPVDCVSHDAVGHIKRACRDGDRPYVPLRSAGLAAALAMLTPDPPPSP